jgi:Lrp/AsnC family transcriptional regulator for asnA, asnC and gidA
MAVAEVPRRRNRNAERSGFLRALSKGLQADDYDYAIIAELQDDGRLPFSEIAKRVGLTEKTVRSRVSHLLDNSAIRIVALTSPASLGFTAMALVGIIHDPAVPASQIALAMAEIAETDYIVVTSGRYSLIVEIIAVDREAVRDVVERKIGIIPGVRQVEIFDGIHLYYQKAGFFGKGRRVGGTGVRVKLLADIDRQIAFELGIDGRAPFRAVADKVGMSETQVRARVGAMVQSRQMNILAIANPLAFHNRCVAWLAIKVLPSYSTEALADRIADIDVVSYILICAGRYDIFAEMICEGMEALYAKVETALKPLAGIGHLEYFVYYDLHYKPLTPRDITPAAKADAAAS